MFTLTNSQKQNKKKPQKQVKSGYPVLFGMSQLLFVAIFILGFTNIQLTLPSTSAHLYSASPRPPMAGVSDQSMACFFYGKMTKKTQEPLMKVDQSG